MAAADHHLSPAQTQQIVALLRATLETFATPVADHHAGGTLRTLQVALAVLGEFHRELTAGLVQHLDQVKLLAPVFHNLMLRTTSDEPRLEAPREIPIHTAPAAPLLTPKPPAIVPPVAASITALAQSLAEAVARLQETLGSALLIPPENRPAQVASPVLIGTKPPQTDMPPVDTDAPAAVVDPVDPLDAFRWLLDAAVTHSAMVAGPSPLATRLEPGPLATLTHGLLEALATVTPAPHPGTAPFPAPHAGDAISTAAEPLVRNPRGDLAAFLDRNPAVARLLTPILVELGLAAANVEPTPAPASAAAFATALARVQVLAAVLQLEAAESIGPALVTRQVLAELEAAGMPPLHPPVDSTDSLDTYRWLLVATQLYNSWRLAPRTPLPRCTRCGRTLQRTPPGVLICPKCV